MSEQALMDSLVKKIKDKDKGRVSNRGGRGTGSSFRQNQYQDKGKQPSKFTPKDLEGLKEDQVAKLWSTYQEAQTKGLKSFSFNGLQVDVSPSNEAMISSASKGFGGDAGKGKDDGKGGDAGKGKDDGKNDGKNDGKDAGKNDGKKP
tara:strand:- start:3 stop:443 length:441 start_codon:yes stop_codon:yes gene_type:complete